MDARRALNVPLTEAAHTGLRAFADAHGVTVTALIEGLAQVLADAAQVQLEALRKQPSRLPEAVAIARALDAERRPRKRTT